MTLDAVRGYLTEERLLDLQIRFAETPSPTLSEQSRADLIVALWSAAGLDPQMDGTGNIVALRPGAANGPLLVVSAHLDTVFPIDQDVRVRRPGESCEFCGEVVPDEEYHGPGIGDCAAGLAAVTGLAEALHATRATTATSLLFVATVGEEGAGDLRGVRALFQGEWASRIGGFVTIDVGTPGAIIHETTASRRFRVTFRGPGGHAWHDFGAFNPIHAAAGAVARIAAYDVPAEPRTTFNVGVIEGGRAVNAIPEEAHFDLDMRSVTAAGLNALISHARESAGAAHAELNSRTRGDGTFEIETTGERPGGSIPRETPLVQAAVAALAAEGQRARFGVGSLDANIPVALGIPAIGLAWGGTSRQAHSVRESYRSAGRLEHVRALARLAMTYQP